MGCVFEVAFAPGCCGAGVEVEEDAACADGHLGHDAFGAVDLSASEIGEAKVAVIDAEDGDVSDGAYGDLSEFGVANLGGWVGGGLADDIVERDA